MSILTEYLLIINSIGFVICLINFLLHKYTKKGNIDKLINIVLVAGGSFGILIYVLLFERKINKENMMDRVFLVSVLIIQIVVLLYLYGVHREEINFAFWTFFKEHIWLPIYLLTINIITFGAFALDKIKALEHKYRIRILSLLGLAFIGGSLGGLIAMYVFNHKTRLDYFTKGIPLMIVMQVFVLFYIMNI